MPRRDAISEKKKVRLMQENEQLQKLMLQSRSSVRRSSLKENEVENSIRPEETLDTDKDIAERVIANEQYPEKKPLPEEHTIVQNETLQKDITNAVSMPQEQQKPALDLHQGRSIIVITPQTENKAPAILSGEMHISISATHDQKSDFDDDNENKVDDFKEYESYASQEEAIHEFEQHQKRRSRKRLLSFSLFLLVALALGFGAYYFYVNKSNRNYTATNQHTTVPANLPENTVLGGSVPATGNGKVNNAATKDEVPATKKTTQVAEQVQQPVTNTGAALGRYKVLLKAYFYDSPDENTRRKAFIIHWNNAVLTPLEEKNGFVYITFTNHLGQTTKGWLRKKDLRKLN